MSPAFCGERGGSRCVLDCAVLDKVFCFSKHSRGFSWSLPLLPRLTGRPKYRTVHALVKRSFDANHVKRSVDANPTRSHRVAGGSGAARSGRVGRSVRRPRQQQRELPPNARVRPDGGTRVHASSRRRPLEERAYLLRCVRGQERARGKGCRGRPSRGCAEGGEGDGGVVRADDVAHEPPGSAGGRAALLAFFFLFFFAARGERRQRGGRELRSGDHHRQRCRCRRRRPRPRRRRRRRRRRRGVVRHGRARG